MAQHRRAVRYFSVLAAAGGLALGLLLSACGLGRNPGQGDSSLNDPVVAATVNGRPIYIEDVRSRAVEMGRLQEGEDLSANSDAFYLTLEELIQFRLFAMEAEARGLDRDPEVRRRLESARERVLAQAIYDQLDQEATDPEAVERLYRENMSQLEQDREIHLRHIQFETREAADAAKRRLDSGERFEALAFELSLDRGSAADGGDLGFREVSDLTPAVRQSLERASVEDVVGPIQIGATWHLLRVEDMRERGAPSLETLRPRIITWLRFRNISELQERLEADAEIVRLRGEEQPADPGEEIDAPADATTPAAPAPTTPDAGPPSPQGDPPPFPFPMGPGGVSGASGSQSPAPQAAPPPAAAPRQTPAPTPAPAEQPAPVEDSPAQ